MSLRESQVVMQEHSEVKIKLLKTYLDQYLNILNMSPYVDDIYYFDLFSAEGIYENGGKGSPIIALESIKNAFYSKKARKGISGKFHVLLNDIDASKIENLKKNIRERNLHYSEIGNLNFENKDYQLLLPEIKQKFTKLGKNEKAFAFIDPYGYKKIRISDVKGLLESGNSEVLLFLPTHHMFRFHRNATPESLYEFINELVPQDEWPKSETGLEFINSLKNGFRDYLGSKYFVDNFVISRGLNQFFCLFFFTSHIYGFDRMLEAKWKLDEEDGRGWKFQIVDSLFNKERKNPNTDKLQKALHNYLSAKRNNAEIYEFTLRNGFLPTHATDVFKRWQNEGLLKVVDIKGEKARKGSFYIKYEYYKKEPNKVFFKLN